MKIAYFSPLSPLKSGIVDYSEKELLPFLKKFCEIDLYIDDGYKPTNKEIASSFKIYNHKKFSKHANEYDTVIYHMGNNPLHEYIYDYSMKYPGIVVLHDIFLHGLIWNKTFGKGDTKGYIELISQMYGEMGKKNAITATNNQKFSEMEFKYPLIKNILNRSVGIIVHSDYGKKIALSEKYNIVIKKIKSPVISSSIFNIDSARIRKKLGLKQDTLIIGTFGFVFPHKRISVTLKAFKKFCEDFPNSVLLIVGEENIGLKDMIKEYGVESAIQTGFVPFQKMYEYMQVSDICINLRYPTAGETSASLLRLLSMRKPVIISNVGWFSELPDDCCAKVDVDNYEEELLLEYLKALASNENLRKKMGNNAREFVLKEHNPEKIAHEYYKFICEVVERHEPSLIKEISYDMADIGINENDTSTIKEVAITLEELGIFNEVLFYDD